MAVLGPPGAGPRRDARPSTPVQGFDGAVARDDLVPLLRCGLLGPCARGVAGRRLSQLAAQDLVHACARAVRAAAPVTLRPGRETVCVVVVEHRAQPRPFAFVEPAPGPALPGVRVEPLGSRRRGPAPRWRWPRRTAA